VSHAISPFQDSKSVHVNLSITTHGEFRAVLVKKGLSMQEVFERLASEVVDGNVYLLKMLDDITVKKRNKELKKFSKVDTESIFDMIERESPLGESDE
jgi:hypothetical protein